MPIPLHELLDLLLRERITKHRVPRLEVPLRIHLHVRRRRYAVPVPVQAAGAEGRESGGLSEADGLHGGVGLGVGVAEVEREVRMERGGFVSDGGSGFGFGGWGFGDGGEGRVVGFVGGRVGVLLGAREEEKGGRD